MTPSKTPSRGAVRRGLKLILRLARRARLATGDKFPPQSRLRQELGLTNFVISGAMEELAAAGVVTRNGRGGTTFLGLDAFPLSYFTVALNAISPAQEHVTPAAAQTFAHMVFHLFEAGCGSKAFFRTTVKPWTPPTIDEFNGLRDDVDNGDIDAVLLPLLFMRSEDAEELQNLGLPVLLCGVHDDVHRGVKIDHRRFAVDAAAFLAQQGCRRLTIVNMDKPKPGFAKFWDGFQEGAATAGLPATLVTCGLTSNVPGGTMAAEQLLALPPSERPDGVAFLDDWMALGCCEKLAATDYRPRLAAQCNLQAPIRFPLPVARFEADLDELARLGVQMTIEGLRVPSAPARSLSLPLRLGKA